MSKQSNQAVKEIKATSDMLEKVMLAEYGLKATDKMFPAADALVHFIKHSAWLESQPLPPPQQVFEATKLHRDVAWNSLVKQTLAAFKSGDGSFFHAMADAITLHCNPSDSRRAFIFSHIGSLKAIQADMTSRSKMVEFLKRKGLKITPKAINDLVKSIQLPTQSELIRNLKKLGLPTDRQTVSRIVKESGQKLPRGKCGPHRK